MTEFPDSFNYKKEIITPKRVGIMLQALDSLFEKYNIDVPTEVKMEGANALSLEQADEESVAMVLSSHFEALKNIEKTGVVDTEQTVADLIQDYVLSSPFFVAFVQKAKIIEAGKNK